MGRPGRGGRVTWRRLLAVTFAAGLALSLAGCPSDGPVKPVRPGAFCSPEGATGQSADGTALTCVRVAGESRARWRAAR
jgi:hypothetical protein